MLVRFNTAVGMDHNSGDVKPIEELKNCDLDWLFKSGAIESVTGPTADIRMAVATTEELLSDVADLQDKWEKADKENASLKARNAELLAENEELKAASAANSLELRRSLARFHDINVALGKLNPDRVPTPAPPAPDRLAFLDVSTVDNPAPVV